MNFKNVIAGFMVSTSLMVAAPAMAEDYLSLNLGWFDLIDKDNEAVAFGAEYRFSPYEYGIRPMVGVNATDDGSVYGYAGLHWDIELVSNQIYLSPNFAAGVYGQGDGKDLGGAIEFRSGLELAYQFPSEHRVGLAFNHVSNASIYDKNPGAETLMITYSLPAGSLF